MANQDSQHNTESLVALFNQTLGAKYQTELQGGGDEPVYLPAKGQDSNHRIIFTRDYFASALHEVAHWCVAGEARRQHIDYGYWYAPDGRSPQQQAAFERVEVIPQAIEWMFCVASAYPFRISADNLQSGLGASKAFRQAILAQAQLFARQGLPSRPAQWVYELKDYFQVQDPFALSHYTAETLLK